MIGCEKLEGDMKRIALLALSLLMLSAFTASAQTWGCGERDLKCQLDSRMKALQEDPKNPENYYNLGIVFQRNGSHKEAIESYSMYVMIPGVKPSLLADGYNNRGISRRALKMYDLAYADYTKAIELDPTNPRFPVNRGNVAVDLKKYSDALADYALAIKIDSKYAQAYAQRALLHLNQGWEAEAMKDFASSIEFDPSYAEPYYNRGTVYSGKKEYAKAIPDYEKYVTLITDPIYLADGYINLGLAQYFTGSPQKAVESFTKVIEVHPTRKNGYLARAMVYRDLKKIDLAEADELRASQLK